MSTPDLGGASEGREPADGSTRRAPGEGRLGLTLAIIMTAAFVQLLDVSIVNVAIPSIQRDLHASSAQVQLVVAGYLLAFAMMLVTGARLGDIFGRRRLFLIGMTGFTLASAACGAAPNASALVVARVVQGAFSALMYPQVFSVIQVNVPPRERGRAFGILGAVIGLATILGPLVGGLLISADIAGVAWRAIFYVNVPVGIAAVVGAVAFLPESTAPDRPRLDIPGAVLATATVFLVVYPLVQGRQDGWPAWGWAMLAAAAPVGVLFALYERRRSRAERFPIVHATLAHDRSFVSGSLVMFIFFCGLPAFFFTLSLYLQLGYGFSALRAGLTALPYALGNIVGSVNSHRLTGRLNVRILTVGTTITVVAMAATLAVVHGVTDHVTVWDLAPVLFVGGIGIGLFLPPVANLILSGIQAKAAGSASGVLSTVQQVGGTVGVALIGVVFFGVLGSYAPSAAQAQIPALHAALTDAGLPPAAAGGVTAGFHRCFVDRVRSNDVSALPPSCQRLEKAAQAAPLPPRVKAEIERAVSVDAASGALALDFRRAFEASLVYELVVFALAALATLLLPRVRFAEPGAVPEHPAAEAVPA